MKYNTKFHREREKEKKKHYLISEIWSFRTFAIVPTNNTNTTTKQRPTHFIDTAIVNVITALSLSLSLSLSVSAEEEEEEKDTDTEDNKAELKEEKKRKKSR